MDFIARLLNQSVAHDVYPGQYLILFFLWPIETFMAKLNKTYNILIRFAIMVITFYFLYEQLFYKHDLSSFLISIEAVTRAKNFRILSIIIVLLLPVNLLLESWKWQFLMLKLEKVSLMRAFKAVLAGISVSVFLPNRVGDYLGRVFFLKKADRLQATLATILGSMAQLLTTILFGLISISFFLSRWIILDNSLNRWTFIGLLFSIFFVAAILIFAFLNFSVFSVLLKKISGHAYNKIAHYADVFSWYGAHELFYVLAISMLRYLVFSMQFFLLLRLFQMHIGYLQTMMVIGIIYLLMSIIPTIALSEIGVRGSVSLYAFGLFFGTSLPNVLDGQIVAASSALWLLNLALPALSGLFFILKLRFFRNNKSHEY